MYKLTYMEYRDAEGEDVEVRIINEVQPNWTKLVHVLKLPANVVDIEKAKPAWQPYDACSNVFIMWLSGEGREPHTWRTVIRALKEVGGYKDFIKKVERALQTE